MYIYTRLISYIFDVKLYNKLKYNVLFNGNLYSLIIKILSFINQIKKIFPGHVEETWGLG